MLFFGKKRGIDATEGPIFSKMVGFVIPLMLTNLLQHLYNMADNIVVGQFSGEPNALGAVGSTSAYTSLLTQIFIGFAAGGGVVVAKSFGARDHSTLSKAAHTSLLTGLISGCSFGLIGYLLAYPVLLALGTKPELLDSAVLYAQIICIGMPAIAVYNFGASILRSTGDSRTPLYTLTASGIVNVLLNLVFVIAFRMSVAGVALATIIAHYISAAVVVITLARRKSEPYALSLGDLRIDPTILRRILRLGVPAAVQGSLFGFSNMFLHQALNTFPTPVVSARTIATNIDVLLSTAINTYLHVTMTFTGQNLGACKFSRIKRSLAYSLIQVTVLGVLIGNLMLAFYEPLVSLYVAADNPYRVEITEAAYLIMSVMLPSYFLGAINESLSGFLRGLGYSVPPMIASLVGVVGFRLIWIFLIFPQFNTVTALYLMYPASWSLTGLGLALMGVLVWRRKITPMRLSIEQNKQECENPLTNAK